MSAKKKSKGPKAAKKEPPKDQRAVYEFFVKHYTSQEAFEKQQVAEVLTSWKKKTLETYWSKQFKAFLIPAGPKARPV